MLKSLLRPLLCLLPVTARAQSYAPSFNLFGSYFPAWMLCAFVSILLAVLLYGIARRLSLAEYLEPGIVTYPCLTAFFSFSLWLIFFS